MYRRTPFVFAIALYLLWQEIGVAAIFGIVYMFLVLPLSVTPLARKYSKNDVRTLLEISFSTDHERCKSYLQHCLCPNRYTACRPGSIHDGSIIFYKRADATNILYMFLHLSLFENISATAAVFSRLFQMERAEVDDERIKATTQVMSGIRVWRHNCASP